MTAEMRTSQDDLRDLADGHPRLVEARDGRFTGVTLRRCLGVGGMSTVFLGELDAGQASGALGPRAPRWLAIKFTKLSTEHQLARLGVDPRSVYTREVAALGRVMERRPPTPFVLGLHGSGSALVAVAGGGERALPWLALEFIDAGAEGATLTERVRRSPGGVAPDRARRLAAGLLEGVGVLHGEGVIHRDIKPDNVFLAGVGGDETPKLADCGIARVSGVTGGTLAAMTPAYGGPEQVLSAWRPGERNPLVGPWTDVHALAATLWFVLAGEEWCRGEGDMAWHAGERRSLRTARRPLGGGGAPAALVGQIDEVLRRGASHRLPAAAWTPAGATYERVARVRFASSMFAGAERHASVAELAGELLPLLDELATRRAPPGGEGAAASVVPASYGTSILPLPAPAVRCREEASRLRVGDGHLPPAQAAVVQPDGRVLACFGDQLLYLVKGKPHRVAVPGAARGAVAAARWLTRAPGGGFLLVGPDHLVQVKGGHFLSLPRPPAPSGPIAAVASGGGALGLVTGASGGRGPLGWQLDGERWRGPVALPLAAVVAAVSEATPADARDPAAAWLAVGLDAGGERSAARWSTGGSALGPDSGWPPDGEPRALDRDPLGAPWWLTSHAVWRRPDGGPWELLYRRDPGRPALVALGFSGSGARLVDAHGALVDLEPVDLAGWRAAADTSLLLD